jgi:hypothetical protein
MGRYGVTNGKTYPKLWGEAVLAGWPSPTVGNATGSQSMANMSSTGKREDGSKGTVSLPVVAGTLTTAEYLALCRGVSAALVSAGQLDAGQAEARLSELASRLRSAAGKVRQQIADAKLRDTPVLAVAGQERFCEWLGFKVAGTFRLEDGNDPVKVEALVANARAAGVRFVVTDYSEIRPLADEVAKQLGLNSTRLASVPPLLDARPSYEEMLALNAAAFLPARRSGASR